MIYYFRCRGFNKNDYQSTFELRRYYVNNKDLMQYDEYRAKGYNLGSGAIEGANKYIVGQRSKLSGMQWTISHTDALIHLRCKYYEGCFEEFWDDLKLKDYLDHGLVEKYKAA